MRETYKSETDLVNRTLKAFERLGMVAYRINSGKILLRGRAVQLMPPGTGDIQGLLKPGKVYFLEAKLPGEKQNANEREWQSVCDKHEVPYSVFYSVQEAVSIVRKWTAV